MGIKFNSAKASTGFAPIPAGKYECFIDGGVLKTASTGNPMISWKFKVRDDVEGQQYGGRVLFNNLTFTENTEGMVHGFLKAIGTPEGKEFADYNEIITYATGKAVLVRVGTRVYKGEEQNDVKGVEASQVGGGKVDDPFAATTTTSSTDPFANAPKPIEVSEDDLPF